MPPLVPLPALSVLRAITQMNLPHRAEVKMRTEVDAGGGERTITYTTIIADLPCRASPIPASQRQQLIAEQPASVADYLVVFAAGAPVTASERLVVSGTEPDGATPFAITLDVLVVRAPRADEVARVAEAKLLTAPLT